MPENFRTDRETAARLRPQLVAHSSPAKGHYDTAVGVLGRLARQVQSESRPGVSWDLRIAASDTLNAYSSPDGTVYVDRNLARLAGSNAGLWAAILSHEIAHVVRRDWARRYLFHKSLESGAPGAFELGDPGVPSASWVEPRAASAELAKFCRRLELDADMDALALMARAGFHPDFTPALHHLLHALNPAESGDSIYAMHPCWEARDRELQRAYSAASIEFNRRWPDWFASPGGNPPVVVFAEEPKVKRTSPSQWELQVPMHCENLVGAVELVLVARTTPSANPGAMRTASSTSEKDRQLSGCTSPTTTVTFTLQDIDSRQQNNWPADIYILDAQGSLLARAEVLKLKR